MSADDSLMPAAERSSPTSVRSLVLATTTVMAVLMYLDRFGVMIGLDYIRADLRMSQSQKAWFVSAFFWSYALCQVPAGWLSDKFGARVMLTIYIIAWSIVTGLMGVVHAVWMMLWLRIFCGIAQAGAYPTAVGLIRKWYPVSLRGTASSVVGLGGRFGGVLAPLLTAWLIVQFVSTLPEPLLTVADIIDEDSFVVRFNLSDSAPAKPDLNVQRYQFVSAIVESLSPSEREQIALTAREAEIRMLERASQVAGKPKAMFDYHDWVPGKDFGDVTRRDPPAGLDGLVQVLSTRMASADFVDFATTPSKSTVQLPRQSWPLRDRRNEGTALTSPDRIRLNRFVLETLFPGEIRKSQGLGWRQTLVLYGVVGIVIALMFAIIIRNTPEQHPWCNDAEKNFINDEATRRLTALEPKNPPFPFQAFLLDLSLWGNSLCQFLTNIGWLFVVTYLPNYLEKVHGVSLVTIGLMTAFPIGTGILGLLSGGRWTDWAARRFGLKWGRRLPLALSRFTAAAGYGLCLLLSVLFIPSPENAWLPWIYVFGLCIAAASTDFGTPAIWAYSQDVGGKYTASILGWGNMWGNFGAAVAPLIYNVFLGEKPEIRNWNNVFVLCCTVFVVSGFCALLLDATKPLTMERTEE